MVILHITSINDDKYSGVGVVVPQHVIHQQKQETVGVINTTNLQLEGIDNQLKFKDDFKMSELTGGFAKPDVVIFHEMYYLDFLKIHRQVVKNDIPYIIMPHGGLTQKAQKIKALKKLVANNTVFKRFLQGASAFHYLSYKEQVESIIKKDCFVVPNGINTHTTKEIGNPVYNSFVYIGRIAIEHKGLDLLTDAIEKYSRNCKDKVIIQLYGPNTGDKERLEEKIRKSKIDNKIEILGSVSGEEKEAILKNTDFFVQTSRFEGMPMGILEALSYGIPCCVTEGTNMADVIGSYKAGYTCQNTAEDIAKMISKAVLTTKEQYTAMVNNAQVLIRENYEWSLIARKTLEKYSEYIKR